MAIYIIAHDANNREHDYRNFYDAIQAFDSWAQTLRSAWLVDSEQNATEIRDHLLPLIDKYDKLIVMKVADEAAWFNLPNEIGHWMSEYIH